ncbi:MAG: TraM recognition domain-containing protein, partial [Eubacteriales bacterium]
QLQNMYEKNWGELSGNCDNTIYLGGGADTDTCEWIAKLIGTETRVVEGKTFSENSASTSLNRQGVEMYSADDLRTMPEDECIVIPKSLNAYKGKKYDSTKHRHWNLVQSFEPYVYDDRKTEYLRKIAWEWQSRSGEKTDHGQPGPEPPEEKEQRERQNRAAGKEADAWRDNRNPESGETLIGDPEDAEDMDVGGQIFLLEDLFDEESLFYSGSGKIADGLDEIFRRSKASGSASG